MFVTPRRALLWTILAIVACSPAAVGALPLFPAALLPAALFAFAVYAFSFASSPRPAQAALVLLSVCFAVTCFDLAARAWLYYISDDRPKELSAHRWPPLPEVYRFTPNLRFAGTTHGDLSAVAMCKDWREHRPVAFVTDEHGFRNDPRGAPARPPDLVVLGDSFCVGDGTTQEDVFSNVLARERGLGVYNLCMDGAGPWQEYVNLLVEGERLRAREGAVLLWVLFEGNDLEDPYFPQLERSQLPWQSAPEHLLYSFKEFRYRSPLRRLLFVKPDEALSDRAVERTFLDGRRVLFSDAYAKRRRRTAEDVMGHPNFGMLKAITGAMRRLADGRHLTVVVALVPSKEEVYSWALDGAPPWTSSEEPSGFSVVMRELCERQGFRFLDLKPALVEASRRAYEETGALLWWRDDTHWNGAGQRVAAAAIYEQLLRDLSSLDEGKGQEAGGEGKRQEAKGKNQN